MTMHCAHCGKQIDKSANFCRFCGGKAEAVSSSRQCPFCKFEIKKDTEKCSNCNRTLIEKIPTRENHNTHSAHTTKKSTNEADYSFSSPLNKEIDWSKLIFNKYAGILVGVILVTWALSGEDTSSGTKAPLPAPIQQPSGEAFKSTIDTSALISLNNGTVLKKNSTYFYGNGELRIKNGSNLDTIAKLIRGGTSVFTVYIKANSNYTITGISDGVYWLAFAQGRDWDSVNQGFRRDIQYSSFDETFDFTTTSDYSYEYYTINEVTLHPVVGGTAGTSSVDPAQFNAY